MDKEMHWLDKYVFFPIWNFIKFSWQIFAGILGIILIIIIIINWLGFFGLIPQGYQPDMREDRYWQEKHDPFRW